MGKQIRFKTIHFTSFFLARHRKYQILITGTDELLMVYYGDLDKDQEHLSVQIDKVPGRHRFRLTIPDPFLTDQPGPFDLTIRTNGRTVNVIANLEVLHESG